jgi:Domain of unknown function (DUF4962)/Heparinase II/III-like protein
VCYLLWVLTITHRVVATFAFAALFTLSAAAQAANESLGPADSHGKVKGTPLLAEMKSLHSSVRPELAGVHPRVYFTAGELDAMRTKVHGPAAAEWRDDLAHLRVFAGDPPPPPAETRRAQNDVAFAIAEGAFAYQMERNSAQAPKILAATKRYMDAVVGYDIWGYAFSKPNTDLAAGHLLYGMGVAYDLLYNDLTPAERTKYRDCIARHGHLMYAYFAPKPGRAFAYSQNHTFIPMAGLAVAAYAVYGEVPEATQWAALSRAIYSRVLETYSKDGYYYEGYEYWIFATPWIIHYLDAQKHATGEDLFDQPGLRLTHLYAAHALLPGGQSMFDFGDVFDGPITRAKQGEDYERSHPGGHFESNYNLLYDLAREFHSSEIQGVADWMKSQGHTGQEPWWTLVWHDPALASQPITSLQAWHRFPDHDVAFWRSSWNAGATAVAFKCGPPEGHHTLAAVTKYPDFHTEQGHVHPDVASFILFAHGQYLTGDSGYAGVPKTIEHNTLLVGGKGQGNEGGHDAWAGMDPAQLDNIRITFASFTKTGFDITGEAAAAYAPALGLTSFTRHIVLTKPGTLTVTDSVESSIPHRFAEVLHTDTTFTRVPDTHSFQTSVGGQTLNILPTESFANTIEPNIVMGPGRPGSVDKGTPEPRGQRLILDTEWPATEFAFEWTLTF